MEVSERIISIGIINKLQNNTKLSSELGIQARMITKDSYQGKTGEMNDYGNIDSCNTDGGFMAAFKCTGLCLFILLWVFIKLLIAMFLWSLGLVFCCTLLLIPIRIRLMIRTEKKLYGNIC